MATTNQNRLLTPEVLAAFEGHELYSQDGKKKDAQCIAVFHIGNIRWYFIEGQKDGEDFIFYGIVLGLVATEYGYVSANEMASISIDASKYGLGILQVEQDKEFELCQLSAIKDAELQEFLSTLYDDQNRVLTNDGRQFIATAHLFKLFVMNELGDIIIILIVFRVFFGILGAWWNGEKKNDFRRDRQFALNAESFHVLTERQLLPEDFHVITKCKLLHV